MAARLKRPEQAERNRALVLAAARQVFLDRGYASATLDAIAEEAGFSKGVIYSQFESKADLFFALLEARIVERAEQNAAIAERHAGRQGVRAVIHQGEADAAKEPGWGALLVEFRAFTARDPEVSRRYAAAHERSVALLAATLERMCQPGRLVPLVSPREMAQLLMAMSSGVTLERAANPAALRDSDLAETIIRAFGL